MKASGYNIIIEDSKSNETTIFNSLYGSMSKFDSVEFGIAKIILENPNDNGMNSIEVFNNLVVQKHLIDELVDEMAIIENRKKCGMQDKNRLDLIIMPTLDCNFSCIYCYEDKKAGKMSNETMTSIKQWITAEFPKFKLVLLSWFGGEPLLGIKNIEEITKHANEIAIKNNVELITHITTNGYSLSQKNIRTLNNLSIINFQITIDGIAETHDKLRPLKNGKGTFDKVYNNTLLLLKENPIVKITLRVNFNHTNFYAVPILLELFPEQYRCQLRLSLEPIFGSCEFNATNNIETDNISKTLSLYYKLAAEMGYDITVGKSAIETGKLVYCYAERENQLIINYNADVFKCSVYNFDSSNRIGYINNEGLFCKDNSKWDEWMNIPMFDIACETCKFLPLCMGGCRKTRIHSNNQGNACTLIPTNASYILKQISYNEFDNQIIKDYKS